MSKIDELKGIVNDQIGDAKDFSEEKLVEAKGFFARYKIAIYAVLVAIVGTCLLLAMCAKGPTLL